VFFGKDRRIGVLQLVHEGYRYSLKILTTIYDLSRYTVVYPIYDYHSLLTISINHSNNFKNRHLLVKKATGQAMHKGCRF
jgi:hypothetical protein